MIDIYVINLKKRPDRLKQIQKDFESYNLKIIEAEEDEIGWKGCFKSHLKCISIGKELGLNYMIVIEDDCKKNINFDDNLKLTLNWLEQNMDKWNIFLGGVTGIWEYNNLFKINENFNLIEISKGKTSHFMIYNSNSYDFFLTHPIDIPIDKCWHNKLNGIVSIPFLAIQYNGNSNIENKLVNYDSRFNSTENNFIILIYKYNSNSYE